MGEDEFNTKRAVSETPRLRRSAAPERLANWPPKYRQDEIRPFGLLRTKARLPPDKSDDH